MEILLSIRSCGRRRKEVAIPTIHSCRRGMSRHEGAHFHRCQYNELIHWSKAIVPTIPIALSLDTAFQGPPKGTLCDSCNSMMCKVLEVPSLPTLSALPSPTPPPPAAAPRQPLQKSHKQQKSISSLVLTAAWFFTMCWILHLQLFLWESRLKIVAATRWASRIASQRALTPLGSAAAQQSLALSSLGHSSLRPACLVRSHKTWLSLREAVLLPPPAAALQ